MISIKSITCNMLQENCYIVSDETRECVIIDCGAFYENDRKAIMEYIESEKLTPKHLLATHGHLDHNFGCGAINDTFGLKVELSQGDLFLYNSLAEQAENLLGIKLENKVPAVGKVLNEYEQVTFGNHSLETIPTPGHTRGSVSFYCKEENVLFTGDTLFRRSIGRTDLESGSTLDIIQSLRMLAQLPDNTRVMPGHGEPTTIGDELAHNPYMDR